MTTAYTDVQDVISAIKHAPESVDLDDVRALLRRVQVDLEVIASLRSPSRLQVELLDDGPEFGTYRVELTLLVYELDGLLRLLYADE